MALLLLYYYIFSNGYEGLNSKLSYKALKGLRGPSGPYKAIKGIEGPYKALKGSYKGLRGLIRPLKPFPINLPFQFEGNQRLTISTIIP